MKTQIPIATPLGLIALMGALTAGPCTAQPFAPADADLSAAYCIGVVNRQMALASDMRAKFAGSAHPGDVSAMSKFDQNLRELQDRLNRLRAYVVPKIDYLDPVALSAASDRGEADLTAILAQTTAASNECQQPAVDERMQCVQTKVEAGGPWQRTQRCKRLDFLPF